MSDPVAPEDKNQHFTEAEVSRLLEHANDIDKAMVLLGAHAGLRVAEIVALRWADIGTDSLTVVNGKGGKTRRVPLSKRLKDALDVLATVPGHEVQPFAFTTERARARLKALCGRAEVSYSYNGKGGMHRLRHAAGFRFYGETRSLTHTAKLLGHASVDTAKIYAAKADTLIADTVANW